MSHFPRPNYSQYAKSDEITGLGDVVAVVAQPIARAIDRVAGTSIQSCGGCAARRQMLNQKFPFRKDSTSNDMPG